MLEIRRFEALEIFGPTGENKQIRDLIAEFERIDDKIKALVTDQSQLRVKMDAIRKQVGLPH